MGEAARRVDQGARGLRLVTARAVGTEDGDEARAIAYTERFPVLAGAAWPRAAVLAAGARLDAAHAEGYGAAAERMLYAVAPTDACRMLTRLASLPDAARAALVAMIESREPDQLRCVWAVLRGDDPPVPEILEQWTEYKRRGAQLAHGIARRYPKILDQVAAQIGTLHDVETLLRHAYEAEVAYWRQVQAGTEDR